MAADFSAVTLKRALVGSQSVPTTSTAGKTPAKKRVRVPGHEVVIRVRDKSTATVVKRGHAVKTVDVGRLVAAKAAIDRPAKVAAAKAMPKKATRR